jgi:RHS repeat-associated protein
MLQKFTMRWIMLCAILLLSTVLLYGQEERYIAPPLWGSAGQLAVDSNTVVEDTVFFNLALRPVQKSHRVNNLVTVGINELGNRVMPDSFRVVFSFKVYMSRLVGNVVVNDSTAIKQLTVSYNKAAKYNHRAVFTHQGAYRSRVKITGVNVQMGSWANIKDALVLQNEIIVEREYDFLPLVHTINTISGVLGSDMDTDSCSSKGEYMLSWPYLRGATSYDVEWAYIDSSAVAGYYKPNTTVLDAEKIFANNASRVNVTREQYQVPLLYDNGGILVYRVRPVHTRPGGQRIDGLWSSFFAGGMGVYGYGGHERDLNWQASTSYAEEGKRKSVVQYFDGSLRNRQVVTKENATCYTVAAESLYDYQGRAVIQVLPAPTLSRLLGYTALLNRTVSGTAYDKEIYDGDADINNNTCADELPGMGTMSGASKYYSAANAWINTGQAGYVPDAQLFPFTETRFTPDPTGRLAMQGGVGKAFQINNDDYSGYTHDTRYYYARANQEELDALFGTEVGHASHYAKNMVKDANGQHSVSYIDMHGRTIATALAGKPSASLDTLTSSRQVMLTKKLLDSSNNVVQGTDIVAISSLMVTQTGSHRLQYSVGKDSINLKDCNNVPICYDCLYNLEITVTDDCGATDVAPITIRRTNFNLPATVDTVCNTLANFPSVDTTLQLKVGSYTVTKRLSLSPEGLQQYAAIYQRRNTCRTEQQLIDSIKQAYLTGLNCVAGCQPCLDSLGTLESFRQRYMVNNGIPVSDTAIYLDDAVQAYQATREQCDLICAGSSSISTSIREYMLADMTPPNGQYAQVDSSYDKWNIFFKSDGSYRFTQLPDDVEYENEDGSAAMITLADGSEVPPTSELVTPADFLAHWQPTWANALLHLHPEYCQLQQLETFAGSFAFDRRLEEVTTYQQAVDSGFLNPPNFTGLPATPNFIAPAVPSRDPILDVFNGTYDNLFRNSMFEYITVPTNVKVSAWALSTGMASCADNDFSCLSSYYPLATAFTAGATCSGERDMAWLNFRGLYLNEKRRLITQYCSSLCGEQPKLMPWQMRWFNQVNPQSAESGIVQTEQAAIDSMNGFITSTCDTYVAQWMEEMAPCNLTAADSAAIIPRLLAVCKAGSDKNHLYGSSTTPPGTTTGVPNNDVSFIQVLQAVLGSRYNATCNAYLITAPKPFDKQPGQVEPLQYGKPDTCTCNKIAALYTQYQAAGTDNNFTNFVFRKTGDRIRSGELDTLRQVCNGQLACKYLAAPIVLPLGLQCNTRAANCLSCAEVNILHYQFTNSFAQLVPAIADTNSLQGTTNRLYESYMNYHTGFALTAQDYLLFLEKCKGLQLSSLADSLQNLVNVFTQTKRPGAVTHTLSREGGSPIFGDFSIMAQGGSFQLTPEMRSVTPARTDRVYSGFGLNLSNAADKFCYSNGYSLEIKFKQSVVTTYGHLFYGFLNPVYAYTASNNNPNPGITFIKCDTCSTGKYWVSPTPATNNTWMTMKFVVKPNSFKLYFNGVLKIDSVLNPAFTINNDNSTFGGLAFRSQLAAYNVIPSYGQIDYIKITDQNDVVKFYEDYNNPANQAFVDTSFICPTPDCNSRFRQYFNQVRGTNYSSTQIDSVYLLHTGLLPAACAPQGYTSLTGLRLCGSSEAIFKPLPIDEPTACDDSTLFSVGAGSQQFRYYTDSLTEAFYNRYTQKCLNIRQTEQLTVTAAVSEHHYTLYYYDQAGSLVKTVPPAGVDVSKLGWAVAYSDSVRTAMAQGQQLTPTHALATQYRYNTLGKVVSQYTPDAGVSSFYYDNVGRLILSQNANQRKAGETDATMGQFSYTLYDSLSRITAVGQLRNLTAQPMSQAMLRSATAPNYNSWLQDVNVTRSQLTRTKYDEPYVGFPAAFMLQQRNLRNRVSFVTYNDTLENSVANTATYYTYDILGNVDTLVQDMGINSKMDKTGGRMKFIAYSYDLASGKVNKVSYQPPRNGERYTDAFYHRYSYDAENRLTDVETSTDDMVWEKEARYRYYLHGPLSRTVLGHQLVQGIDHTYTLQGWLKGTNGISRNPLHDPGGDGQTGSPNQYTARDAYSYNLHYYNGDYQAINTSLNPHPSHTAAMPVATENRPLYNGNISAMAVNLGYPTPTAQQVPQLYNYTYDQLNRLTAMDVYRSSSIGTNSWAGLAQVQDYKERIGYDANGNILTYLRHGFGATLAMDNMAYQYNYAANGQLTNNRLKQVTDAVPAGNYSEDIDGQAADNYSYDEIGNLTKDNQEGITSINWNVYGKIVSIQRTATVAKPVETIRYTYDAGGNRLSKRISKLGSTAVEYTYYVRDATGNVMAVYTATDATATPATNPQMMVAERHLYGSSRLGLLNSTILFQKLTTPLEYLSFTRGDKIFELVNHLGNVLATISDKKIGVDNAPADGIIDYYTADVITAQDYYPFGMNMPGRSFSSGNQYRYGFNGKEKSNEIYGEGNAYDFGARIQDPRLGRWLSVDPKADKYAHQSPYAYVANNPIIFNDGDGKDFILMTGTPEALFNTFKSIIEKRFGGLMTVSSSKITTKGNKRYDRISQMYPTATKVSWTLNEEKLNQMAAARSKNPNEIAAKKQEILQELQSSFSYQQMDKIINGDVTAMYNLYEGGQNFGVKASFQYNGTQAQGINVDDMMQFADQDVLTSFNMMFHEIMEGYYIFSIPFISKEAQGEFPTTQYNEYGYGHWNSLLSQARDAGLDFLYSRGAGLGQIEGNKEVETVTFKKITSGKDKGKYTRSSYIINIEGGKITSVGQPSTSTVDAKTYKKEKDAAKKALQNHTKRG